MDIVVKRECEEEIVESEEESAREPDKESSRDDDEESAREDEEGTVEADEANEEKAVEDHAVENEEDPVDSSPKSSQPSFDPEEEITLCMRSVEPVSCLFATVIRKNDLVPIKYEPIDESEYASSTEEPTNNTLSCSSEEPTHNDPSCSSDGFMNNVVSPHSDEAMNSATSVHSDQTTSNAVSDRSDEIISSFVSDYSEESTNNVLPVYSQRLIHTVVPYQDTSNAMYNHSDEEAAHATVSDRCYAMNGNAAASAHSSQTTASNATHPSDEASHNSVSDRCYAIASDVVSDNFNESMNNVLPCTSDEFMNNTAPCYSDVCVSEEEETLSLQVLSEEPSSCLYRMPASLEREGGLVAIKQEPIDEVAADTETLANLINPYRYDMADTKVKQEPLEGESCTAKECGLMETEHQSSDLRGHNPEISDMQDIECCSEGKDADSNTVCGMVTDALSVQQQVVYSPSVAGSSSIGDDDDWMVLEDLEEDVEEEQDDIYKKIFDVMIESKPIMIKPGQNKGHERFRLDAWIEDNKSPIVLTNEEKERACKRRKIMKAKLHKPFIIKKKINCVWLVEADTA
ncbi:hypothetical protein EDC94DRAFT_594016 [Helicostylum pulchrum]|nr:hypothetical protein EDC94DRAFT_594016 [Helicostylum pulchrum]